jgi:glycosyltransferase involved in cell wall biosynthesis
MTLDKLPGPFDLVHGINVALEQPLLAAVRYATQRRLPLVITPFVHVGESGSRYVLRNYVMRHQLEALRQGNIILTQTNLEANALAQLGLQERRLRRLGMGVNLQDIEGGVAEHFRRKHSIAGPLITFMGSVTRDKGAVHLVEAMRRLWDAGRQISLAVAGPPAEEFLAYHSQLPASVKARVMMLGPVLGQDKRDLFAATTALAVPSRIDSFGIVYLEAWACGKPVIGAQAGGVPDVVIEGEDGLLVPYGDVRALAESIARLVDDPALAAGMGARGRAKVERSYTWERLFGIVEDAYDELMERVRGTGQR